MLRRTAARAYSALEGHPRLKRGLKEALRHAGLLRVATRLTTAAAVESARNRVAAAYLRGAGLEIGAMHFPLRVPPGVRVKYVDRTPREEAVRRFPELDADAIVEPDILEDGFRLPSIADASQDFVVANHVLEHAPDPIGAISNWARVVRPGGIVFVSVPIGADCFDLGRAVTDVGHMIDDHRLLVAGREWEFWERNQAHYEEWIAVSLPNLARERGEDPVMPAPESLAREARELAQDRADIHFHVFSTLSLRQLLVAAAREVPLALAVETVVTGAKEAVAVVRVQPADMRLRST